ncbi:MAG: RluA family pseudouridine synthase, partial [Bdellovibrionaceae bacterium]|nr:RluA family pseudouridine synthase [Pseudobdellovibrionaceae bacterium]
SHGFAYGVKHFHSPDDGMAIDIIKNALILDQTVVADLFQLGAIYINNQRCLDPNQTVSYGHQMRVHTKPRRYDVNYDWKSRVIFEHDDFVILNKPSGLPSHPSVDNVIENSLTQLERALNIKLLISHRLDTTTEGIIVYGKKTEFVKAFNIQLQSKNIEKKYVALIQAHDKMLPTRLIHYMEPSPRAPKKVTPIFTENWDECELLIEKQKDYEVDGLSEIQLIRINLLTGRTHQIRAQLSETGYPLLGDKMYGSNIVWGANKSTVNQVALKSCSIDFTYLGQRYHFELPQEFESK